MIFDSLSQLSVWTYAGITLALTHVTIVAVTIFLHRHQAHRALSLHPAVSHFFRFWLWFTTATVTREWVAVHRKHHAMCETPDDPHSPQTRGIARVLFGGLGLYRAEARNEETMEAFGKGTPDDWVERNVYARFRNAGLVAMLAVDVLLFGWVGLAIFAVQILWIPFWAAGVINGIGHYWGYRNFETDDASRNIVPTTEFLPAKCSADVETMKAVIRNRYHVLKLYGTQVIRSVLRVELTGDHARRQLRVLRKWMTREDIDLSTEQRTSVDRALSISVTLKTVFEFKEQLKSLMQPPIGESARLRSLQTWCANAEATGIEVLDQFAQRLRGYHLRAT